MDKAALLATVLLELAARQNRPFDATAVAQQLQEAAANNGLDASDHVPDWLIDFFEALRAGQVLQKQPIPADEPFTGDIASFLAELEDIVYFEWHDSGEIVELIADKLRLFGLISSEDATYEVGYRAARPEASR